MHIRRAIEVKPDAPALHYLYGVVAVQFGDLATAGEQYEVLRKLDARMASFLGPGLIVAW
jgi:Flp pilus assembly protein TadD